MDEDVSAIPLSAADPPGGVAPRHSRALIFVVVAVLFAAAGVALWWISADARHATDELRLLRAQVEAQAHDIAQMRTTAESVRARQDDGDKVDRSMREQLLGLSERAHLLEDALANLADKRLSGHDTLALDEAELLLALGGARYALFHDTPGVSAAYRQADIALSEIEDPTFATVRQSVAAEITALNDAHAADGGALVAQLQRLRTQARQWPAPTPALAAASADARSPLARAFGAFVQIRHDDMGARAALVAPELAREGFQIDLREAEAAALARDEVRFQAALESARAQLPAAFDPQAADVAAAAGTLDSLAKTALAPPPPALLGSALKELRNLRATHALREGKATRMTTP